MEPADKEDVRSLMLGVMNANSKLDAILYILTGGDDEEEADETDG